MGGSPTSLVNGVFKGGGASGIAYIGALKAFEERGMWFSAVAGASAGAITAALVATGAPTSKLEFAAVRLGMSMPAPSKAGLLWNFVTRRNGLLKVKGLRLELGRSLAWCLDADPSFDGTTISFEQLFNRTQITLYVVAMDAQTGEPIVFSHHTTPETSVVDAVIASSAIPFALPSQRMVISSEESAEVISPRRIVDGATVANYPDFIFRDSSFRYYLAELAGDERLTSAESERTFGFQLRTETSPNVQTGRQQRLAFVHADHFSENDVGTLLGRFGPVGVVSRFLNSLIVLAAVFIWSIVVLRSNPGAPSVPRFDEAGPSLLFPVLAPAVTLIFAFGSILVVMLCRHLVQATLPSAVGAASTGVRLAAWKGAAPDDHLITLDPRPIGVVDFGEKVSRSAAEVIARAHRSAAAQLNGHPVVTHDVAEHPQEVSRGRGAFRKLLVTGSEPATLLGLLLFGNGVNGIFLDDDVLGWSVSTGVVAAILGVLYLLWGFRFHEPQRLRWTDLDDAASPPKALLRAVRRILWYYLVAFIVYVPAVLALAPFTVRLETGRTSDVLFGAFILLVSFAWLPSRLWDVVWRRPRFRRAVAKAGLSSTPARAGF